ncbi:hypothetical protein DB895_03945 [Flavobacterium psychrotolerans]|uniref:Uncharacterized protein n=1 Tax=Flavobacterium psychrotolerans TaxID=2169410 RepID=A0A2U1JN33_9FLAO|nr:hypothetical protein DB895_03945 [Flavobacterium psychrotolerans]
MGFIFLGAKSSGIYINHFPAFAFISPLRYEDTGSIRAREDLCFVFGNQQFTEILAMRISPRLARASSS